MLAQVHIAAPSVPPSARERFVQTVNFVSDTVDTIAKQVPVPPFDVTVVLTDDFIADVRRFDTSGLNQTFSNERIGGVVAAKNLPQADDYSRVTIVFASDLWRADQGEIQLLQTTTVAHEFAHPLLGRARYASGVMKGVNVPAQTAAEMFRASGRAAWDEYRADLLAYSLVAKVASKTVDGVTSEVEVADIAVPSYVAGLVNVLDSIHPAWPQIVQDYREWRLDTPSLWMAIAPKVDQLLTWLAHVEATTTAAGISRIVDSDELGDHSAMRLYVRDHWTTFANVMRRFTVLPALHDLPPAEVAVMDAGEAAFRGILGQLGLRVFDRPDGSYYIHVVAPER